MRRLVALDLPGGAAFVEALERVLDAGDAAFPLDQRLAGAARTRLIGALRPAVVRGPDGTETPLEGGCPVEDGDALVLATSGSTGDPKGVVLTHAALEASARATSERLGVDPAADRWLCCLPLSHVGGLSVVTRALATSTPLEVHPGFAAERVLEAAARGATLVSLVPTTLRRLGDDGAARFRTIVLGGSTPPGDLPDNVVTTYGSTETGSGIVYDGVPLAGVELRIASSNDAEGSGEILVRAPMLARAYRDGSRVAGPDGWFGTGDVGRLDTWGRLVVLGRRSDRIISGGENVWPEAVERVLAELPGIREVAVAGRPDAEWGERVVAYVVVAPGHGLPPVALVRDAVEAVLGPWCAPKELIEIDELPRTSIGKLARSALPPRRS